MGLTDNLTPEQRLTRIARILLKGTWLASKRGVLRKVEEQMEFAFPVHAVQAVGAAMVVEDTPKS